MSCIFHKGLYSRQHLNHLSQLQLKFSIIIIIITAAAHRVQGRRLIIFTKISNFFTFSLPFSLSYFLSYLSFSIPSNCFPIIDPPRSLFYKYNFRFMKVKSWLRYTSTFFSFYKAPMCSQRPYEQMREHDKYEWKQKAYVKEIDQIILKLHDFNCC